MANKILYLICRSTRPFLSIFKLRVWKHITFCGRACWGEIDLKNSVGVANKGNRRQLRARFFSQVLHTRPASCPTLGYRFQTFELGGGSETCRLMPTNPFRISTCSLKREVTSNHLDSTSALSVTESRIKKNKSSCNIFVSFFVSSTRECFFYSRLQAATRSLLRSRQNVGTFREWSARRDFIGFRRYARWNSSFTTVLCRRSFRVF